MTNNDLIYLAGFIDGEGCFTHIGNNTFRITISSTNKDILVWIQSVFGGYINNLHLPKNPKHNMAWKWVISKQSDMYAFLPLIIPYLKIKKPEAEIIYSYLSRYYPKKQFYLLDGQKQDYEQVKQELIKLKSDLHYKRS